jgi:hypothetical protein
VPVPQPVQEALVAAFGAVDNLVAAKTADAAAAEVLANATADKAAKAGSVVTANTQALNARIALDQALDAAGLPPLPNAPSPAP